MSESTGPTHQQLANVSRDVLAYVAATYHELDKVADAIAEPHLLSPRRSETFLVIAAMEALHAYQMLADATGRSVEEILEERGRLITQL